MSDTLAFVLLLVGIDSGLISIRSGKPFKGTPWWWRELHGLVAACAIAAVVIFR